MTIIPDVYPKLGIVLKELRPSVGSADFSASQVTSRYKAKYPGDDDLMKKRQAEAPTSHSLEGYLDGMLAEYARRTSGDDPESPAIEHIDEMTYRFKSL